jgi:hypothetical protein
MADAKGLEDVPEGECNTENMRTLNAHIWGLLLTKRRPNREQL